MADEAVRTDPGGSRGERSTREDRRRRYDEILDRFDDDIGPGREEVDAWAARERRHRREWIEGPTERDRVMWARRERGRRLEREIGATRRAGPPRASVPTLTRELALAAEGAAVEFFTFPFRFFDFLVESGRRFEERSRARRSDGDFEDDLA
jgi:hypothetical protein